MHVAVHDSIGFHFDPDYLADYLAECGLEATVVGEGEPLDAFDAAVTFGPGETLFDVEWVHCVRAGYDEFPVDAYDEAGIAFTNSTGIHDTTVGETVVGMLTAFARRLHVYRDRQRAGEWELEPYDRPFTLAGERVCVVGLGTLGGGVATRADALGMDVVGVRRTPDPVDGVSEVFGPDELHDAIGDARFVVLCVPLSDETEGLVGPAEFDAMRDDAYLVNVARGPVVDRDALLAALRSGDIAGAGLDAHHEEPLPPDAPEWGFDEVIVTPHVAAMTNTYHEDVGDLVLGNAERLDSGDDLVNRVV